MPLPPVCLNSDHLLKPCVLLSRFLLLPREGSGILEGWVGGKQGNSAPQTLSQNGTVPLWSPGLRGCICTASLHVLYVMCGVLSAVPCDSLPQITYTELAPTATLPDSKPDFRTTHFKLETQKQQTQHKSLFLELFIFES